MDVVNVTPGTIGTMPPMTTHDALSAGKHAARSPLSSVTSTLPQIYGMKAECRFWAANR